MNNIVSIVKNLKNNKPLVEEINKRYNDFKNLGKKSGKYWFSELCFCILTANSKAETAINIQKEIGPEGFINLNQKQLSDVIRKNKHRFHNNKSKYIIEARKFVDIKKIVNKKLLTESSVNVRNWIAENIKGLGYKESSHFLRNVGIDNLAILDRHILRIFHENKIIKEIPTSLSKKYYLENEITFCYFAKKLQLSASELDLFLWFTKTSKILK